MLAQGVEGVGELIVGVQGLLEGGGVGVVDLGEPLQRVVDQRRDVARGVGGGRQGAVGVVAEGDGDAGGRGGARELARSVVAEGPGLPRGVGGARDIARGVERGAASAAVEVGPRCGLHVGQPQGVGAGGIGHGGGRGVGPAHLRHGPARGLVGKGPTAPLGIDEARGPALRAVAPGAGGGVGVGGTQHVALGIHGKGPRSAGFVGDRRGGSRQGKGHGAAGAAAQHRGRRARRYSPACPIPEGVGHRAVRVGDLGEQAGGVGHGVRVREARRVALRVRHLGQLAGSHRERDSARGVAHLGEEVVGVVTEREHTAQAVAHLGEELAVVAQGKRVSVAIEDRHQLARCVEAVAQVAARVKQHVLCAIGHQLVGGLEGADQGIDAAGLAKAQGAAAGQGDACLAAGGEEPEVEAVAPAIAEARRQLAIARARRCVAHGEAQRQRAAEIEQGPRACKPLAGVEIHLVPGRGVAVVRRSRRRGGGHDVDVHRAAAAASAGRQPVDLCGAASQRRPRDLEVRELRGVLARGREGCRGGVGYQRVAGIAEDFVGRRRPDLRCLRVADAEGDGTGPAHGRASRRGQKRLSGRRQEQRHRQTPRAPVAPGEQAPGQEQQPRQHAQAEGAHGGHGGRGIVRVGARRHLGPVVHTVAIGVGHVGVGSRIACRSKASGVGLYAVGEAVAVGVGKERIRAGIRRRNPAPCRGLRGVGKAVAVGIADQRRGARRNGAPGTVARRIIGVAVLGAAEQGRVQPSYRVVAILLDAGGRLDRRRDGAQRKPE